MVQSRFIYMAALLGLFTNVEGKTNIRLVGSSKPCEGRVEINMNGLWGTVCEPLIHYTHYPKDKLLALVVCRHMDCISSSAGSEHMTLKSFGSGSGEIFYSRLNCTGTESNLWECKDDPYYRPYCRSHNTDVGVVCSEQPVTEAAPLNNEYVPDSRFTTACIALAGLLALSIILLLTLTRKLYSYRNELRIRKGSLVSLNDSVYLNIDSDKLPEEAWSGKEQLHTKHSGSSRRYQCRGELPRRPENPAEQQPSSTDTLFDKDVPYDYNNFEETKVKKIPLESKGSAKTEISLPVYVIVKDSFTKGMPNVSNELLSDELVPSDYDDAEGLEETQMSLSFKEDKNLPLGCKDYSLDRLVPSDHDDIKGSKENKISIGSKDALSNKLVPSDYEGLEENQMSPSDYDDIEGPEENKITMGHSKDVLSDKLVSSDYDDIELEENLITLSFKDSLADMLLSSNDDVFEGLEKNQMPLDTKGFQAPSAQNAAPRPPSGTSGDYDDVDFFD
uniref:SRCR domain-containing protein n=1 Tax=Xenopus tropicalis TaxID=8364 RepID=A0A803JZ20_XENTR